VNCGKAVYSGTDDPDYRDVLSLVAGAVREARARPRRDVAALAEEPDAGNAAGRATVEARPAPEAPAGAASGGRGH